MGARVAPSTVSISKPVSAAAHLARRWVDGCYHGLLRALTGCNRPLQAWCCQLDLIDMGAPRCSLYCGWRCRQMVDCRAFDLCERPYPVPSTLLVTIPPLFSLFSPSFLSPPHLSSLLAPSVTLPRVFVPTLLFPALALYHPQLRRTHHALPNRSDQSLDCTIPHCQQLAVQNHPIDRATWRTIVAINNPTWRWI